MCRRVTVCLFITKSYIQLDTTHSCLLHPEAELPLYLLGSHLEFLALNGSPSPVDLTKCVVDVVCIMIMQVFTARVTLQMSDLVARMARGTATV